MKLSDFDLPGEGLLVWKVDESKEQLAPSSPGLTLVQADGRNDLDNPNDWNQGDAADPFPGSENHTSLTDSGPSSTSFPGKKSGIALRNIDFSSDGVVTLYVDFAKTAKTKKAKTAASSAPKPKPRSKRTGIRRIQKRRKTRARKRR